MRNDHEHLIVKLDAFIRKYYKDRLIRGVIYSIGLLVLFFLIAAFLEHIGHFGTAMRTGLFWGSIAAATVVLARFVALPLVKLFRLGEVISPCRGCLDNRHSFFRGKGQVVEYIAASRNGQHPACQTRIDRSRYRPTEQGAGSGAFR
ncbi:MAG: hypothetical protein IPI91_00100 [Flavobacteriales bacterium]|nr:hypothetical protein [Flavobacteriales bacterium]